MNMISGGCATRFTNGFMKVPFLASAKNGLQRRAQYRSGSGCLPGYLSTYIRKGSDLFTIYYSLFTK